MCPVGSVSSLHARFFVLVYQLQIEAFFFFFFFLVGFQNGENPLLSGARNTQHLFSACFTFFYLFFSKGRNKARYCVYICFFLGTNTHARTPVLGVGCHISVCNSTKTQSHMHTVEGYCSCCWAQGDLRRTSSSAVPVASLHEQMSFIQ
uniref:(northern house mosquito) hypothetical protein n=1 Tax=Culex pipiens TaxID=7175 RepID=A0A8D8DKZ5_CULPI